MPHTELLHCRSWSRSPWSHCPWHRGPPWPSGPGWAALCLRNSVDNDIYALQVLEAGTADVGRNGGPREIVFARPSPNPAHAAVTLRFALQRETRVRLSIYDMSGRRVRELASGAQPAGDRAIAWDLRDERGRAVGAGLYFARLEADGSTFTQRLVALK